MAVSSFGLFLAAGLILGALAARQAARRDPELARRAAALAFWAAVAALIGARSAELLLGGRDAAWGAGLSWEGGLLGGAAAALALARWARTSALRVADALAPGAALALAVGRIGCFTAGCCYGRPIRDGELGVAARFGRDTAAYEELVARGQGPIGARLTPALHATQVYEAAAALATLVLLALVARRARAERAAPGAVAAAFLAASAVTQALVGPLRGDGAGGGELLAVMLAAAAIAIMVKRKGFGDAAPPGAPARGGL